MISFVVALAVAAFIVPAAVRGLIHSGHVRPNYRGIEVAFPLGVAIVVSGLVALAPLAVLDDRADMNLLAPELRRWITYLLGIAFLGVVDDALGRGAAEGSPRGWRGHARALGGGDLSTGAVKAIGAFALAAFVVSGTGRELPGFLLDVLLLILATNLFNLFDTGPGRAEKALILLGAGLGIGSMSLAPLEVTAVFAAPTLIAGWFSLRERAMLGDTGSNLLGAVAGVWLLTGLDETGRLIALLLVLSLTIFGEFRSISATIRRVPPLRTLDSLGRPGWSKESKQAKETATR